MNVPSGFTLTITAAAVAWYAAIVSTLSALVATYVAMRDRRRLKLRADLEYLKSPEGIRYKVVVRAANIGRRPITIVECKLFGDRDGYFGRLLLLTETIERPRIIEEGSTDDFHLASYTLLRSSPPTSIKLAVLQDHAGARWVTRVTQTDPPANLY